MSSRVFHHLLNKVGDDGSFQTLVTVVICAIFFQFAFITYSPAYLLYQDAYICPDDITDCQEYVCSLPPQQQ